MLTILTTVAYAIMGGRGFIKGAIAFFSSPLGRVVGMAMLAGAIWVHGDLHGHRKDRAVCEAKAAEAAEQAKAVDQGISERRVTRSDKVLDVLSARTALDQLALSQAVATLTTVPPQSTQPGTKKDDKALVDDQCRLTRSGERRVQ